MVEHCWFSPLLIASLARHLGLFKVTLLLDAAAEDGDLATAHLQTLAASGEALAVSSAVTPTGAPALSAESFSSGTLVVDPSGQHRKLGSREFRFTPDIYWLVSSRSPGDHEPLSSALRLDSNFFTLSTGEEETSLPRLLLLETYKVNGKVVTDVWGTWNGTDLRTQEPRMWERRGDMRQARLRATTIPRWKRIIFRDPDSPALRGLVPDILENLEAMSNFTTAWDLPADGMYGTPGGDGAWNGMVGMVQRGEADLIATALHISYERSQVIDFSRSFLKSLSTLIVANPARLGGRHPVNLAAFSSVFSVAGWCLLLLIFFGTATSHLLIHSASACRRTRVICSLASSLSFTFKTYLRLDPTLATGRTSGKILLMTASACATVTLGYYEGTLTSFMTVKAPAPGLRSFEDTIAGGYRVLVLRGSAHDTDLAGAPPGSGRRKVYEEHMTEGGGGMYHDTLAAMKAKLAENPEQKLAISSTALGFIGDGRFLVLNKLQDARIDHAAFGLAKDSEYLGLLNYNLMKMRQSGLLSFLTNKWIYGREPKDVCGANSVDDAAPLGYENVIFLVGVLLGGITLASATSLIEYSCLCWKRILKLRRRA